MGRLLRRLLFALSLVAGADLVLFLTLDSGLLGDPSLIEVGQRASPKDVGFTRLRQGRFSRFDADAIQVRLNSTTGAMDLWLEVQEDGPLSVRDFDQTLATFDAEEITDLGALAASLSTLSGSTWTLEAFCPEDRRALPLSGTLEALRGLPLRLKDGVSESIPWAETVPPFTRFLDGFVSLLRFDFGLDRQGRPVTDKLQHRGGRSLLLSVPAFVLSTLCAIALALWAAARRRADRILQTLAVLVMSVSSLAWILFLRQWLALEGGWFPVRPWSAPVLPLLTLPILIWVWLSTWPDFLLYRSLARERAAQDWMLAARARGLSTWRIWLRHLLPNLAAPLATLLSITLPFLILGSLLLEYVFDIPGLGNTLVEAVQMHDTNLLRALTFLFALAFLSAQWLGEVLAMACDPRLRRTAA
ncbi:MAG: ABC transporter permease subunit [Planctomycetota bacterium]